MLLLLLLSLHVIFRLPFKLLFISYHITYCVASVERFYPYLALHLFLRQKLDVPLKVIESLLNIFFSSEVFPNACPFWRRDPECCCCSAPSFANILQGCTHNFLLVKTNFKLLSAFNKRPSLIVFFFLICLSHLSPITQKPLFTFFSSYSHLIHFKSMINT